jgi:hypothetical protein
VAIDAAEFIKEVTSRLGDPYVWGGTGPSGFDCSGLVYWALVKMGAHAPPRTSEAQWGWVQHISYEQLQPGDLVFSQWPGDNASPGHVQIYIGGGNVIGADTVNVEQVKLATDTGHVVGYGRIPGISGQSGVTGGGAGGGLLSLFLPAQVLAFFSDAEKFVAALMWLVNPENWMRLLAGGFGILTGIAGILFLVKAAG